MKRVTFSHSPIPYLFVLPQIAIIAVFFLWPSFEAIQLSFYLEDPWGLSNEFVWFENYQTIFEDPEYVGTLIATLIFSLSVTFL
ncbi:MAG: sugar ABC transporter permease, partial [bacterium]